MKKTAHRFIPHLFEVDMGLPKEYKLDYQTAIPGFEWDINWTDITYQTFDLDMSKLMIDFYQNEVDGRGLVSFDFPLLKDYLITAHQHVNTWILPSESKISLQFKDFDIDFKAALVLNEEYGYLDPVVYSTDIKMGETTIEHDDKVVEFVMHGLIKFIELSIENSSYFLGDYMFTKLLGPILDHALNHYMINMWFPSIVPGQFKYALLKFDYRNVWSSEIHNGYADFRMLGEYVQLDDQRCSNFNPETVYFANDVIESQLVVTRTAV